MASPGSPPLANDVDASDPAAAHFFSAPPVTYEEHALPVDAEPVARRVPANPVRRRRLGRVVAGAVALSCAICVAAGVRVATVRAAPTLVAAARESPPAPLAPLAAETVSESPPPPQPDAVPDNPPVAEAVVEAPQATDTPPVAPAPDPAGARDAKRISQRALDRGDAKASIEAGEQSVALDPTDAEAWLILGAAYQARGTYLEARRCFSTCVHVGTRGPRGECAALLR